MEVSDFLLLGREALIVVLKISGPIMIVGLLVGLIISFFQALTQMQEATLSFVPKILIMFVAMIILLPYMYDTLAAFTETLFDRIATGE